MAWHSVISYLSYRLLDKVVDGGDLLGRRDYLLPNYVRLSMLLHILRTFWDTYQCST